MGLLLARAASHLTAHQLGSVIGSGAVKPALPPSDLDALEPVTMRLVFDPHRAEFGGLPEELCSIHPSRLTDESLCYVVELDRQWVVRVAFRAPSLHLKERERWIGWGLDGSEIF